MPTPSRLIPDSLTGQYLLGYHGCDEAIAEAVLTGKERHLKKSANLYDWLGHGAYFWVDSPDRALEWAKDRKGTKSIKIKTPYVLGAVLQPGRCLNLTDLKATKSVGIIYKLLAKALTDAGEPIPTNDAPEDGVPLRRKLDCAVINYMHQVQADAGEAPYDSVLGVFEEGKPTFLGSSIRERTHIQVAVINLEACIKGYFRVPGF